MSWVVLHLAAAVVLGAFAGRLRAGRWGTLDGLLEFGVAIALPGLGAPAALLGLGLERLFARTVRPASAAELTEEHGPVAARPPFPPEDVLRIGVDAGPVEDRLCSDDPDALELCLQRLARSRSRDALERLREAGATSRPDVRVRLRTLMVRLEREFMRDVREGRDPGVRGDARQALARLAGDPATAREHLEQAVAIYREGLRRRFDPAWALALGELLLDLDRPGEAFDAYTEVVHRRPADPRGYAGRMQAAFRQGDRDALRRDARRLAATDAREADAARRWIG
jgi:tetratricopeptide (TPR) repeat protein